MPMIRHVSMEEACTAAVLLESGWRTEVIEKALSITHDVMLLIEEKKDAYLKYAKRKYTVNSSVDDEDDIVVTIPM